MTRALALLAAALLPATGCSEDVTEILLVVDSDVCEPAPLDQLTIEIDTSEIGADAVAPIEVDLAGHGLPRSLGLVHRGGKLGPIAITVTGRRAGAVVVARSARVHFRAGRTRVLHLALEAACVGVDCTPAGQTCALGVCRSIDVGVDELEASDAADAGPGCGPRPDGGSGLECDEGRFDCNGMAADGCESALRDLANCGACAVPCARPRGVVSCETGVCTLLACEAGARDCNAIPDDGCESDLRDLMACGGCGIPCALPNAVSSCGSGACTIVSCTAGHDNCDTRAENGCEIDVRTNPMHCGRCGMVCPAAPAHAASMCADGRCGLLCDPGWADCDSRADTGCEASLSDAASCGDCGAACPAGTPYCSGNASLGFGCVATCPAGTTRCVDACANLDTSALHCGRCGNACPERPHAAPVCASGSCEFRCDAGWDDCNGEASDGCETPLDTKIDCGGCGARCAPPNATASCAGGTCAITGCLSGFGDCGGGAADGCETPLDTATDCGGCDVACSRTRAISSCAGGVCHIEACTSGYGDCDGIDANGCETDLRTDEGNCGGCGRLCDGETCEEGTCDVVCTEGSVDCNGDPGDGCEVDTTSDPAHCGSCTTVCDVEPHAVATCGESDCGIECLPGFGDCDDAADGCETDYATSLAHCGACMRACTVPSRATSRECSGGACAITGCDPGHEDCDGAFANGCEAVLARDVSNCGMCGRRCAMGQRCTSGTCT